MGWFCGWCWTLRMLLLGVLKTEAEEEDTERMLDSLGRSECSWEGIRRDMKVCVRLVILVQGLVQGLVRAGAAVHQETASAS